jgi:serine protease AprX
MRKIYLLNILSFALLLVSTNAFSQFSSKRFFIRFTDKNNSPYSVSSPSAYLSARAIQRRANQGIAITQQDFPVNPQYIDSLRAHGATIYNPSKWLNGVTISCSNQTVLNNIAALPFVADTTHVKRPSSSTGRNKFEMESLMSVRSNNAPYESQSYSYGASYNQIHLMNGEYLHNLGFHGEGMIIALLDAGFNDASSPFQHAFDSLRNRGAILGTWDFVNNESDVYTTNSDDPHGAAVLSCIAGNVPDTLVGTAPMADFYLLRSEDAPTENIIEEYNWATAAEYADSAGADIISSSLGYTTFDDATMNHTYADMNGHTCPSSIAGNIAFSKGMLVVVAAGNEGSNTFHFISAPSDGDSVMSIGGVDSLGHHVSFSSWGPASDGDVKPNVAAKAYQAELSYNGILGPGNGTSFATPILAGSAACLWQAFPSMTNHQIKDAIQRSANYFNNPNDSLGYGIPNFMLAHQLLSVGENAIQGEALMIYPNPINQDLKFILKGAPSREMSIEIFDAIGKLVYWEKREMNFNSLNLVNIPQARDFSKGIYFLKVTAGKVYSQRIVKI